MALYALMTQIVVGVCDQIRIGATNSFFCNLLTLRMVQSELTRIGYPLGLIYFVLNRDGLLEVLDGQQRIPDTENLQKVAIHCDTTTFRFLLLHPARFRLDASTCV